MAWKHDRERFPPHRFELIGPGRYREKATGATWVDSRDMEHAFEEAADESDNAKRELARKRREAVEPPAAVREQADLWAKRHRARLEGRVLQQARVRQIAGERERIALRRDVLTKIRGYWQAQGQPEPDYIEPELLVLAECEAALDMLEEQEHAEADATDDGELAGDGAEPAGEHAGTA